MGQEPQKGRKPSRIETLFILIMMAALMTICIIGLTPIFLIVEHVRLAGTRTGVIECVVDSIIHSTVETRSTVTCRRPGETQEIYIYRELWERELGKALPLRTTFMAEEVWKENIIPFLNVKTKSGSTYRNFRITHRP